MLFNNEISENTIHKVSCDSICVVYKLYSNPKLSTNSLDILIQSIFGYDITCALKLPTVPLNFPVNFSCFILFSILLILYINMVNSFPTVVGVAFCPCVCESIGFSLYIFAFSVNVSSSF